MTMTKYIANRHIGYWIENCHNACRKWIEFEPVRHKMNSGKGHNLHLLLHFSIISAKLVMEIVIIQFEEIMNGFLSCLRQL